jgi:hypothetical protein
MDVTRYFQLEIDKFVYNLKNSSDINSDMNYKIIVGSYRCLGRVRDYIYYNVNKRCKNLVNQGNTLCKKCANNCPNGLVINKINNDCSLYTTYKKKNPNFEIQYDNNIKLYSPYNLDDYKDMMRKIEKRISSKNHIMDEIIDIEHISNKLSEYITDDEIKSINIDDITNLYNIVIRYKKQIVNKLNLILSLAEGEELFDNIMRYIKKSKVSVNNLIDNSDMITLKDLDTQVDINMIKKDDKINPYHLYFKTRNDDYILVGYGRNWIDLSDDVPEQNKNHEGIVLDDDTQLPVLEVEINDMGSLITGIPKGIYREWEYDENMEQFRKTSYIERF